MNYEDVVNFVKKQIDPLPASPPYGLRYRVSATISDGTVLPCVVIESVSSQVDLAIKRFNETRMSDDIYMGYRSIVTSFVTRRNTVNLDDLKEIGISPYAIPPSRMQEIKGETSMGWTAFSAVMRDGKEFQFGTGFYTEFFDMPPGYTAADIVKIIPTVRGEKPRQDTIYRERLFFTCYVDGL